MRRKNLLFIAVAAALCVAISRPAGASTDTTFTYQGRLLENGEPVTGTVCDLRFTLWNDPFGGSQIGAPVAHQNWPVFEGNFTVELDYGVAAFNGGPRWLSIEVRCPAGSGPYVALLPRQPITRTPYSMQTRGIYVDASHRVGIGTTAPAWPFDLAAPQAVARLLTTNHANGSVLELRNNTASPSSIGAINFVNNFGQFNGQIAYSGADSFTFRVGGQERMRITGAGNVGIGVTGPAWPLHIESNAARALMVRNTNTGGERYGLHAQTLSTAGRAVFGYASATTGLNYGGLFESDSNAGRALQAHATSTSGPTYGVYSLNDSTDGTAIFGWAAAASGGNVGVVGASSSTSGRGVSGIAEAASGTTIGVFGLANSPAGYDFFAGGSGVDYGSNSSIRWKRNITPIHEPLHMVSRLRGVTFDWDAAHGGQHDVGMIAEEVGAVLPEIVQFESNGIDAIGMDYSKLTPLLVEAVNALRAEKDAEIADLHQRLAQKDAQLLDLAQRIAALERAIESPRAIGKEHVK